MKCSNIEQQRKIINKYIQYRNIDNVSSIAICIMWSRQNDLIIPVLNYLFDDYYEDSIICNNIILDIYINSCSFNNIDILKNLILYCFKYNYKFDIHCRHNRAYYNACFNDSKDILLYLTTINKKYYYTPWTYDPDIKMLSYMNDNPDGVKKLYKSFEYVSHIKKIKYRQKNKKYYVFNNNIENIYNFYYKLYENIYTICVYYN